MTTKATQAVTDLPSYGFRNKLINGRMEVAQRGDVNFGIADGEYSLDRWRHNQTGMAVLEHSQVTDVPAGQGLINSLRINTTIPDTVANTGDRCSLTYHVEGHDIVDLYGETITLSFWVKSTQTGTYCVALRNATLDRYYIAEYTMDAANTWERKVITVDFNPDGSWSFDTGIGLELIWTLHHYGAGGVAGSWQPGGYTATANQINHTAVAGDFWITGVELVKGESPLPVPEVRSYGAELALCQRYCQRIDPDSNDQPLSILHVRSADLAYGVLNYTPKRAACVIDVGASNFTISTPGGTRLWADSVAPVLCCMETCRLTVTATGNFSGGAGSASFLDLRAGAIIIDAEF